MDRRSFLSLGGLFGVGAGLAATVAQASRPTDPKTMLACEGEHEPADNYFENAAICIANRDDGPRTLVPCKRCGALFALHFTHETPWSPAFISPGARR